MSAFKAYDIRGIYGKDINEDLAYRIGYFLPQLLEADHIVVGRDIRLSSPSLHDALISGSLPLLFMMRLSEELWIAAMMYGIWVSLLHLWFISLPCFSMPRHPCRLQLRIIRKNITASK